jgi:hypothetical protein
MSRLIELTPLLALAVAGAMLASAVDGQLLERMLREVGQPLGRVWDTAFVHHVGYWSHYEHELGRSTWPLPPTNDCNEWARFAKASGLLLEEGPRAGDVFLLWSRRRKQFVHSGLVAAHASATGLLPNEMAYVQCETIEGNVDAAGHWYQNGIHRVSRKLVAEKGDRLIRWADFGRDSAPTMPNPHQVCLAMLMRERAA